MDSCRRLVFSSFGCLMLFARATALAQSTADPQAPIPPSAYPPQTELNLVNLPTTLSVERHHSYFRLTHRFARDLRRGDLGDLASDLFSLDNGAVIGLEYRFGITSTIHAGVHRSMLSKTIQTFARWDVLRQHERGPLSVSITGSVEGLDNMRDNHQPAVAFTLSRVFGDRAAFYLTPAFVGNTRAVDFLDGHDHAAGNSYSADDHAGHDNTWLAGLGARLRILPSAYIVGEYTPRLGGYDPNAPTWAVAIEKRTGGHTLQVNFTNSFGTTWGQLARGGSDHDIYLGFNVTRKF
jgi:hypothetical protein